jgi:hypothetical protein
VPAELVQWTGAVARSVHRPLRRRPAVAVGLRRSRLPLARRGSGPPGVGAGAARGIPQHARRPRAARRAGQPADPGAGRRRPRLARRVGAGHRRRHPWHR